MVAWFTDAVCKVRFLTYFSRFGLKELKIRLKKTAF